MKFYIFLITSINCFAIFIFDLLNLRMKKTKILCLHGYGTNANFMKKQSVSFRKIIEKQAQLIFVDGPFEAPQNFVVDQKVIDMIEGKHLAWSPKIPMEDLKEEFIAQLDKIRLVFEAASDHYDGIMGFSQGTIILHFLLRLKEAGIIKWKILDGVKFTINLNGNHLKFSKFKNDQTQLEIPSLHIISPEDFLYPKSILHTTQYKNPIIISHSYGHKFPKLGLSEQKVLRSFIRKHSGKGDKKRAEFQILSLSSL